MPTIEKIVTSTTTHRNLFQRDRDFIGTFAVVYEYKDQFNVGPATQYTFANQRTTYQPSDWNYRDRIRRHLNATTTLIGDKYVLEKSDCSWQANWDAWDGSRGKHRAQYDKGRGWPRYASAPLTPEASFNPDAALQAKMRLYKTLKDKRQAWEGMVFLGELRELIHMVRNPAQSLRRGLDDWINSAKKHRPKSSTTAINRALAGSWLEWVYGIAPTISDLSNAQEALNRHLDRYEELYQKFYVASDEIKSLPTNWVVDSYTMYPWTFTSRYRKYVASIVAYYGQVYTSAATARGFTRQQLGFELRNFVPTVWELIPYSFVADYFTNIGDLISASSTHTGDVAWVSQTVINDGVVEHVPVSIALSGQLNSSPSSVKNLRVFVSLNGKLTVRRRKVTRSALAGVPVVSPFKDFRFEIPGVGSTKWINLLALFQSSRTAERLLRGGRS